MALIPVNINKIRNRLIGNYMKRKEVLHERGVFSYLFNSSGYVLIIVLLVTSLLISVSAEFMIVAQTNIQYVTKFSEKLKSYTIARAGVNFGLFILEADKRGLASDFLPRKVSSNIDSYYDLWAIDFPDIPLEYGSLRIRITDEQSKINLSILANEFVDRTPYYMILQKFFTDMGYLVDLADCVMDWVDIDDIRSPYGAESSDYYMNLDRPYRAKNRQMDSINELLMVKGFTPEIFFGLGGGNFGKETNLVDNNKGNMSIGSNLLSALDPENARKLAEDQESNFKSLERKSGREKNRRLSDYLRVYGERSTYLADANKININTAPFRVLSALTDNMTDDTVAEIIRRRIAQPFNSPDEVKDLIPDENVRKNILTVKSTIFKIEATGIINNTTTIITVYYHRDNKSFLYWSEQ